MQVGKEKTRKKQKQKQNRQETNNWSPPFVFFFKKRCVVSPFLSFKRFAHFPALEPWGRRSQGVNSSKGSPCLWISKLNHNFKNLNLFFFLGGGKGLMLLCFFGGWGYNSARGVVGSYCWTSKRFVVFRMIWPWPCASRWQYWKFQPHQESYRNLHGAQQLRC